MTQKVYLIDLGTGTDRNLLPLASGLITAYSNSIPEIRDQYVLEVRMMRNRVEEVADELESPTVVGFLCYCWNILGNRRLANICRERFPDAAIVFGGPSIPTRQERVRQFFQEHPAVDVLVHGEGELTFADLLLARIAGRPFSSVDGISVRGHDDGHPCVTTPPRPRIEDFSRLPSPFLDGTFDRLLALYGDAIVGALWETNRGCPYYCTFCDWGSALVNKVTKLEIERLRMELQWVATHKLGYVYATDANFGIFRERDLAIAQMLTDFTRSTGYPNHFVLNWTKNSHQSIIDIARTFHDAGVHTNVTLSVQSFNPKTLGVIKRRNLKFDVLKTLKTDFHDQGVRTYTEFILALPEETRETFLAGLNAALTPRLEDQFAVYNLCILENTEMAGSEYMSRYQMETRTCAVGLNRRRFKYERFGEDIIVVGTSTMPVSAWMRVYELSFTLVAFYNLRICFFPMACLHKEFGMTHTDFVEFVHTQVWGDPASFPTLARAFAHLRRTRDLILASVASVSEVLDGGGIALTPHEALVFHLLNDMGGFYREMARLCREFCEGSGYHLAPEILDEVLTYQRIRMPVWQPGQRSYEFATNVPRYFERLCRGEAPPPLTQASSTIVDLDIPPQTFGSELEFNLRRVSSGYTLQVFGCRVREAEAGARAEHEAPTR